MLSLLLVGREVGRWPLGRGPLVEAGGDPSSAIAGLVLKKIKENVTGS